MSLPDLDTDKGRAEYRKELRDVAKPIRFGGLALIVLAAIVVVVTSRGLFGIDPRLVVVGYGLLAAGWALYIASVFIRTRHHKRRLAEGL
ncbi:hypothetical protein BH10PSE2_BH10PSE2_14150 [soil metagenome]